MNNIKPVKYQKIIKRSLVNLIRSTPNRTIVSTTLKFMPLSQQMDYPGKVDICHALNNGDHKQLQDLIENGNVVNFRNEENMTPLMIAVLRKDFDSVNMLVHAGALLHERDDYGRTALNLADETEAFAIKDVLITAAEDAHGTCQSLIHDEKSLE